MVGRTRETARRTSRIVVLLASLVPLASLGAQPSSPVVDLRLDADHDAFRPRVSVAIRESLADAIAWLGPSPVQSLTLGDTGVTDVAIQPRWPGSPATMDVESQVAYEVVRSWWPRRDTPDESGALVDGAAWYLQSRIVERLYDLHFKTIAYHADSVRWFGGGVRWAFLDLPLSRWATGLGRDEYLRPRRSTQGWPGTAHAAMAFATLERYLGWPALQGALQAWAHQAWLAPMTRTEIAEVVGAAAGQDLSWFFETSFDPALRFDYRLDAVATAPGPLSCTPPCYRTRVTLKRIGTASFSGSSRAPAGPYENGDALDVLVRFADGTEAVSRWDGRQAERVFEFDSAAPAAEAQFDPSRTVLLDQNYLDNTWRHEPGSTVPVAKWMARWIVWLQNAMLSYGALV